MYDPDPDKGSQGIDAPGQVHLAEILHNIPIPVNAGDSKDDRLFFLAQLSKEVPIRPWCNGLKTIWCHSSPLL